MKRTDAATGRAWVRTASVARSTLIYLLKLGRSIINAPPVAPPRVPHIVAPGQGRAARRAIPLVVDWLLVALAVGLFIAIAAHQWRLPGLYNDEAYDVVPAMQLVLGQPVDLNRGVGLHLFGHALPLMISDYQGVSSMYTVLPLFAIFGVGVGPVRAMTIGFAALAILLTYLFGRALFGRASRAGSLSGCWRAVHR